MIIREETLTLISVILSVIGVVVLFVVRESLSAPLSYDSFIEAGEVRVVLEGEAKNIQLYEWGSRFLLETTCSIPVISSKEIQEGSVVIYGSKRFYQGRPEVSAERIVSKE